MVRPRVVRPTRSLSSLSRRHVESCQANIEKKVLSPTSTLLSNGNNGSAMTTIFIGSKQVAFSVDRKLLCEASPFFCEHLQAESQSMPVSLWLPRESSAMFALFVEWIHSPNAFRRFLDDSLEAAHESSDRAAQDVHWAIVRLHLFASHLDMHRLQDLAMDAIQDLYLKFNWDVSPSLVIHLYTQCEAAQSMRLRRWVVAMVAFSLHDESLGDEFATIHPLGSANSSGLSRLRALLHTLPEFAADHATHLRKTKASGLDICFKNPQLRIPANKLRSEQRVFGFRECSFHSHRAAVGERRCPHSEEWSKTKLAFELGVYLSDGDDSDGALERPFDDDDGDAMPRPLFSRSKTGAEDWPGPLRNARSVPSALNR